MVRKSLTGKLPPLFEIDQEVLVLPFFTLERGETLKEEPVAYKAWGKLNDQRDSVMIICHAFTGSLDPSLFFIFSHLFPSFRTPPAWNAPETADFLTTSDGFLPIGGVR